MSFLTFAWEWLPELLKGTQFTLTIWVVSVAFGFFFGWLLAIMRVYGNRALYWLSTGYVEFFRGTPMLVQMFVVYLGLPNVGIVLSPVVAAIVAIGLNTSAYQAEYFRGGIRSIRSGQMFAARAIGMSKRQAITHIIIPQALRLALPQWSNEVILELKYTSIAFTISVPELMGRAHMIGSDTFRYFQIFVVAAAIYLVLVGIVSTMLQMLEQRYSLKT